MGDVATQEHKHGHTECCAPNTNVDRIKVFRVEENEMTKHDQEYIQSPHAVYVQYSFFHER